MIGVHAAARDGFRTDRLVSLGELADVLTEMYDELAQHVADRLECLTRSISWPAVAVCYNHPARRRSRSGQEIPERVGEPIRQCLRRGRVREMFDHDETIDLAPLERLQECRVVAE